MTKHPRLSQPGPFGARPNISQNMTPCLLRLAIASYYRSSLSVLAMVRTGHDSILFEESLPLVSSVPSPERGVYSCHTWSQSYDGPIDPHIPTMPSRSTSSFHRPDRNCLHQARKVVRCRASSMKGELHPSKRTGFEADFLACG